MIIEIEEDVIKLSGKIERNLWPATQAATQMMLGKGYKNIIVDCTNITFIQEKGLETFSNAFNYMTKMNVQIFFVAVDEKIEKLAKKTLGIRSSMPIAESIEEVRGSIAINNQASKKYTDRDLIFPMIGNPSHAIIFADFFADKDREFNFIYPMLIPMKYNLYSPIKSLENKVNSELLRAKGFCIFYNRIFKSNIIRSRKYKDFFKNIEYKYPNSRSIVSFAGCDFQKHENIERFLSCFNSKCIILNEPFLKENPFKTTSEFNKILVYYTGIEEYDKQTMSFVKKFVNEDNIVEFIKPEKVKFNIGPKPIVDSIENFKDPGVKNYYTKTISVKFRSEYFKDYAIKNNVDLIIIPLMKNEENFLLNMIKDPVTSLIIINNK